MNTHEDVNPYFEMALAEHRELHQRLEEIRTHLTATPTASDLRRGCAHAVDLLTDLLGHLTQHFTQEEEGGYMEEALSLVPRLGPQAAALERQHQPLLEQLRGIIAQANRITDYDEAWSYLTASYTKFYKALLTHESAENGIIQEASNCDLGMQD